MKSVAIGLHLRAEDVEGIADATTAAGLVVSGISVDDDQPLGDRDLLVRAASVRAQLLDRATFVAVRYGFTFRSAADVEAKIGANARRWRDVLEENRTRVELTLKVVASNAMKKPDRHDFESGADYIRALQAAKNAVTVDEAFKRSVEEHVGRLCVERRWLTRDASSLELAGLIERARLGDLQAAGDAVKRACPDVPFLLSAPWPLEVFADADHE